MLPVPQIVSTGHMKCYEHGPAPLALITNNNREGIKLTHSLS